MVALPNFVLCGDLKHQIWDAPFCSESATIQITIFMEFGVLQRALTVNTFHVMKKKYKICLNANEQYLQNEQNRFLPVLTPAIILYFNF